MSANYNHLLVLTFAMKLVYMVSHYGQILKLKKTVGFSCSL